MAEKIVLGKEVRFEVTAPTIGALDHVADVNAAKAFGPDWTVIYCIPDFGAIVTGSGTAWRQTYLARGVPTETGGAFCDNIGRITAEYGPNGVRIETK